MFVFRCVYCKKEFKREDKFFCFSKKDGGCCKKCLEEKNKSINFPVEMSVTFKKATSLNIRKLDDKFLQEVLGAFRRGMANKNVSYISNSLKIKKVEEGIFCAIEVDNKENKNLEELEMDINKISICN